eukprot:7909669-Alexandrium_andersonii.AAC.1
MGHCFSTKDGSDVSVTVLVLTDRASRAILARPVLRKGRLREDAAGQCPAPRGWGAATRSCSRRTASRPWLISVKELRRSRGPRRFRAPRRPTSRSPTAPWRKPSSSAKG